jgi:hypothetical protein
MKKKILALVMRDWRYCKTAEQRQSRFYNSVAVNPAVLLFGKT